MKGRRGQEEPFLLLKLKLFFKEFGDTRPKNVQICAAVIKLLTV
jgi:hypothetical protein